MSSNSQTFVTFAYGSNMLACRVQQRCPSARALGIATLRGYELRWHKRSQDGSGKCDVVQTNDVNRVVYSVLYEIPESEKAALNTAEGLGQGYEVKPVGVLFNDVCRGASIYYSTRTDPSLRPYTWYKALVVAGAREHGLPRQYIEQLEATATILDSDTERHDRNSQLTAARSRGPQS